jgi:hypothetical protein
MIVLQELDGLDHILEFIKADGTIDNDKWKKIVEWASQHFDRIVECFKVVFH